VIIGDRLRALRVEKELSQGDIEKRTGLLRCYLSRVENGHTVPSIETLEKLARALEVPLYHLFYDQEEPPSLPDVPIRRNGEDAVWGSSRKEARMLTQFRRILSRTQPRNRAPLLSIAGKMCKPRRETLAPREEGKPRVATSE
jgi:transcriptional regulator with XRE-family HTH domain